MNQTHAAAGAPTDTTDEKPFLTVVRGNPTDEDVAVLIAVLASAGSAEGAPNQAPRDHWGSPLDRLRPSWGGPSGFTNLRY